MLLARFVSVWMSSSLNRKVVARDPGRAPGKGSRMMTILLLISVQRAVSGTP
jgi:hypothetical protein